MIQYLPWSALWKVTTSTILPASSISPVPYRPYLDFLFQFLPFIYCKGKASIAG